MRSLNDHLRNYGAYHRDQRNIATHFVGIPMIVFAVQLLLSRPNFFIAGLRLNPACLLTLVSCLFYFRLDRRFGLLMTALLAVGLWGSDQIASQPLPVWLGWGIVLFLLGWVIQFIGHRFEGRKPAFLDDIAGLIIGPLFVVAEALFLLGLRPDLKDALTASDGATRRN